MCANRHREMRVVSPSHLPTWRIQPTKLHGANGDIAHAECDALVEWADEAWSDMRPTDAVRCATHFPQCAIDVCRASRITGNGAKSSNALIHIRRHGSMKDGEWTDAGTRILGRHTYLIILQRKVISRSGSGNVSGQERDLAPVVPERSRVGAPSVAWPPLRLAKKLFDAPSVGACTSRRPGKWLSTPNQFHRSITPYPHSRPGCHRGSTPFV